MFVAFSSLFLFHAPPHPSPFLSMWRHCKSPALQTLPTVGHWYSALCLWEPFSQSLQRDAAAFEGQGEDGGGRQWLAACQGGRCGDWPQRVLSLTLGIVLSYFFDLKSRDFKEYMYKKMHLCWCTFCFFKYPLSEGGLFDCSVG